MVCRMHMTISDAYINRRLLCNRMQQQMHVCEHWSCLHTSSSALQRHAADKKTAWHLWYLRYGAKQLRFCSAGTQLKGVLSQQHFALPPDSQAEVRLQGLEFSFGPIQRTNAQSPAWGCVALQERGCASGRRCPSHRRRQAAASARGRPATLRRRRPWRLRRYRMCCPMHHAPQWTGRCARGCSLPAANRCGCVRTPRLRQVLKLQCHASQRTLQC